jgi:oligosaccharide repeat unit polymerase
MIQGITLYVIVMGVYLPGLVYMVRARTLVQYPVVGFTFLGIFLQNAFASIAVIFPELVGRQMYSPILGSRGYFSLDYVGMLVVQALLFYAICGTYLRYARPQRRDFAPAPNADRTMLAGLLLIIGFIVIRYVAEVGMPPLVAIVTGTVDAATIIDYRIRSTYGMEDYSMFALGMSTLTLVAASYALFMGLARGRIGVYVIPIVACAVVSGLPGGKGSMLDIAVALIIAYLLFSAGYTTAGARRVPWSRIAMFGVGAFVPVLLLYRVYAGDRMGMGGILREMLYRMFGVNSESFAATYWYTRTFGFMEGRTLPTLRGLLSHEQINTSEEMHYFMFGPRGGAPISGIAEGYLNFGWIGFVAMAVFGFLVVVAVQAAFNRLPANLFTLSMLVVYTVFATKISQVSLFATFVSLTYIPVFVLLFGLRGVLSAVFLPRAPRGAPLLAREAP